MVNKKYLVTLGVVLVLAFVLPTAWALTDRLVDGGFESGNDGINSWDETLDLAPTTVALTTSPTRTGNGAMLYTNVNPGTGSPPTVSYSGYRQHQCMDLNIPAPSPARQHVTFSGYVYVPDTATNFQNVRARIRFYQGVNPSNERISCFGGLSPVPNVVLTSAIPRNAWVPFSVTGEVPANALDVVAILEVGKTNGENLTVYFDDLRLYDSSPTAVSLQSFSPQKTAPPVWFAWGAGGMLTAVALLFIAHRLRQ